jgi:hypothetical protein
MASRLCPLTVLAASIFLVNHIARGDDLAKFSKILLERQTYSYYSGDVSGGQTFTTRTTLDCSGKMTVDGTAVSGDPVAGNGMKDVQFAVAKALADGSLKELQDRAPAAPDASNDSDSYAITIVMNGKTYAMSGKDSDAPLLPDLVAAVQNARSKFEFSADFTGTVSVKEGKVLLTNVKLGLKSPVGRPLDDAAAVFTVDKAPEVFKQLDGQTVNGNAYFQLDALHAEMWSVDGVAKQDVDLHKTTDPSSPVTDHYKQGDAIRIMIRYTEGPLVWVTHPGAADLTRFPGYAPLSSVAVGPDLEHAITLTAPSKTAGLVGGLKEKKTP